MKFAEIIIGWYHLNKRDLPWRHTQDPYRIWIAEVILQQTRITQGIFYYNRFLETFPNAQSLAAASEDEVLKIWQGLGYYTRARNLHAAARYIASHHNGIFPSDYKTITKLPGIGPYTAAAIASFAFGYPYPVIDGNVIRVVTRIFGIDIPFDTAAGKQAIMLKVNELIDRDDPATFNQAIMEFGAICCKPLNPSCENCIFKKQCIGFTTHRVAHLPVRKGAIRQRPRYFNYLVFITGPKNQSFTLLTKRVSKDIWKNLFEFPLIETEGELTAAQLKKHVKSLLGASVKVAICAKPDSYRHILSHQVIHARFYTVRIRGLQPAKPFPCEADRKIFRVSTEDLDKYAVSRLTERYLMTGNWNFVRARN